ncbi:MAG: YCF48-related protein [Gammaproteobacteria bacterium]|jgi:hypothetical protein
MLLSPVTSFSQNETEPGNFHRFWPDNLYAVEFVNDDVGFIAGYSGTVLRTRDGGENWDAFYIGRNELIRRLSFVNENTGWAVGHRGSIFHTKDAGQSWEIQKEISGVYLRDVDFIDENNGWVVGHDTSIWNTKDGGNTWLQQELLGFIGRDKPRLHGIYAKDANTAILVGEFGTIAHTENGGATWLVTPNKSKTTWLSITGSGESFYAVGLDGNIVRLSHATDEQREAIAEKLLKDAAKKEKRARAKAKRLKREYVPVKIEQLPESEIEYHVEKVDSNTSEHLFDIALADNGEAIVVGKSKVLKLIDSTVTELQTGADFPLAYIWLGGVAITPDGTIWSPGIRGLVVSGKLNEMTFGTAFNLAASKSVKLVSSRWGDEK